MRPEKIRMVLLSELPKEFPAKQALAEEALTLLGGSADLHAGQVVDRTGVALGLGFPAGPALEKLAMAYYLDGRVSALWGTHTHVPTADGRVFPKGTGYITDLGMTGPVESVLGVEPRQSVESFLGGLPGRYRAAEGPCKMQGAIFALDSTTGLCTAVDRIDVR